MRASFRFCLEGGTTDRPVAYQIADRALHSDLELPHLTGYRVKTDDTRRARSLAIAQEPARQIFSGPAFVGGRDRRLDCEQAGGVATLSIAELGTYQLDLPARAIRLLSPFPEPSAIEQALCGPCLALLMAHAGDFLLHASAVRTAAGIVALVGRSGSGKSTLAAELAARSDATPGADDALVVRSEGGAIVVPGAYPQPKWPLWGAARRADPPARLAAVIELAPDGADPSLDRLSGADALLAASTHTVAARLFDAELLQRHFRFGRKLAARVPWWRLRYRPRLRNLDPMVDQVRKLWSR